jgi:head-tail adaptor
MPWPAIDQGRMVHWITILQQTPSEDESGTTMIYSALLSSWAAIDPVSGTDVLRSGQVTTQLFLTITMRWQAGIASNMRVRSNNGTYVIQSIENPGERNVLLVLNCLALGSNE